MRTMPLSTSFVLALAAPLAAETHCGSGPASIPDGTGATCTWTIDIPAGDEARVITSARVMLSVTHPWVGDLSCEVVAPGGTTVRLIDRVGMPGGGWIGPWGCGGDDISCLLDDGASSAAEETCSLDGVPVLSGNLRPLESLGVFIGTDPAGSWVAMVTDHSPVDAGTLGEICLVLETAPDCNGNGMPDADDISGGSSEDVDGDGVPDECQCMGDIDGDGSVNVTDLLTVIANWGCTTGCPGDANADGIVNVTDLLAVISAWGECS